VPGGVHGARADARAALLLGAGVPARAPSALAAQKRRTDPDYRENQHQAQQRWAARQGAGYWRRYRAEHPEYTAANRAGQRERDRRRRAREGPLVTRAGLAKMDASAPLSEPPSGTYRLVPVAAPLAKMDVWTVELHRVSVT